MTTIQGRPLSAGEAHGVALALAEPLSLWGGLDPVTGMIIDAHHPQEGADVRGRILVMPSGRGSSSSSSVLAEAVRLGTAPAGIIVGEADLILTMGAAVAQELYGSSVPIVQVARHDLAGIRDGTELELRSDGLVRMSRESGSVRT